MRVFLDANVIIAVLNRDYPLYTHAAQVLSLADDKRHHLYVSPLTIAIAFYFASKKSGEKMAKQKIALLLEHVKIAAMDGSVVKRSLETAAVEDLEDGMQYQAALDAGCDVIVTENADAHRFGEISVHSAKAMLSIVRD